MSEVSLMYDLIWESCYSYKSRIFFCPTKFPLIFWSVHCICLVYFQWELKWLVCCSFWVAGVCTSLSGQNILQNCNPIFGNMHEDKLWMWFNFLQFYYCVCIWKQIVVQIWCTFIFFLYSHIVYTYYSGWSHVAVCTIKDLNFIILPSRWYATSPTDVTLDYIWHAVKLPWHGAQHEVPGESQRGRGGHICAVGGLCKI